MKLQHSMVRRLMKIAPSRMPVFIALVVLFAGMQLLPSRIFAQSADSAWKAPYTLPAPAGWGTEHFPLPPDFAPTFTYKGIEDIRFHPGWGDTASKGYWSYAYLWWLDGKVAVTETTLQQNFQAYYSGLVGRNIEPRKIPANKVIATEVVIKKAKPSGNDAETFAGTIRMLDYMAQRPMVLNCIIHVKNARTADKSAVFIEVSPQAINHEVWKEMDKIAAGFVPPPNP